MLSQVVDKLNRAQVFTVPFDHIIIKNFLPDYMFQKLERVVNETHSGVKEGANVDNQIIIDTRNSVEYPSFWEDWYSVFENNEVKNILLKKFNVDNSFDFMRCDIHKCSSGFVLGCHNDVKSSSNEIVSLQIYITENDDENGVSLWNGRYEKIIKHIENKPNTAWLFKAHSDSWHSVQKCTRDRQSVLMKYMVK